MIPAAGAAPVRDWWFPRLHPAVRLAAGPLGVATLLAAPAWWLPLLLTGLGLALRRSGLPLRAQFAAARAWWFLALLVLAIHTVTTVSAAPLGHPSWFGALRGLIALGRAAATVAALALLVRAFTLGEAVAGVAWWGLTGWRGGPRATALAVTLAVALGAVPGVMAEGRRVGAALRLRRGALGAGPGPRRWRARLLDAGRLLQPLLETLFRRAETLTLSLRWRLPRPPRLVRPPLAQLAALLVWAALLAAWLWRGRPQA